ncbi:MAG: sodium:proton antiporter, partial [Phycisphaerae bacterium]|nr:sodium:proton antiporter [Phycisphaerae bacterium]
MITPKRQGPGIVFLTILIAVAMPALPVLAAQGHAAEAKTPAHSQPAASGHSAQHGGDSHEADAHGKGEHQGGHALYMPNVVWVTPFVILLLCIALLPLIHKTEHWWEHNSSKLLVAIVLGVITTAYYMFRGQGFHEAGAGLATVKLMLSHAILADYIPFIVLLFSLYVISGGINLSGDLRARPITNTAFIGLGALLASFIGTTGASMLLIRPLLQTNSERKNVKHTVIVFIFLACNIGGCLLPIGDPPLFLGYLRGVPFLWTFHLWKEWLFLNVLVLGLYFVWDSYLYSKEAVKDIQRDEQEIQPIRLGGSFNILLLLGVVLAVGTMVPNQKFP